MTTQRAAGGARASGALPDCSRDASHDPVPHILLGVARRAYHASNHGHLREAGRIIGQGQTSVAAEIFTSGRGSVETSANRQLNSTTKSLLGVPGRRQGYP